MLAQCPQEIGISQKMSETYDPKAAFLILQVVLRRDQV